MKQKTELYCTIEQCIMNRDEHALLKIYQKFEPLLKKYSWFLNYEDAKADLAVQFYRCIYKIPIETAEFFDDKYILSYIEKSIKNIFITLNSRKERMQNMFCSLEDISCHTASYQINTSDMEIKEFLATLPAREKDIFFKKYYLDLSDKEIANHYGLSRQAINKSRNKVKQKFLAFFLADAYH